MDCFEASDKDLRVKAACNFGWIGAFKKQFDGFFQIGGGGFHSVSLTSYVKFWTEGDIPGSFFFYDSRVACRRHSFSSLPKRVTNYTPYYS